MANKAFAFGKNWQSFVKNYLNEDRSNEAKKSLNEFYGENNFKNKTFIDIGCGSGLFSLAAYKLGASEILSFDVDPDSVKCCEYLREQEGNPDNWKILTGSILDDSFVSGLNKYDMVYSWGVLHHTGNMWQAIENAAGLVNDSGNFYIAIYNKADGLGVYPDGRFGPSKFWVSEKKIYTSLPLIFQNIIDYITMFILILAYIITLNNPVKKIKNHKSLRGMSWRVDIKDWLGGYPYEYASVAEIFHFFKNLGFSLENVKCNNGLMNNEFLFKKNKSKQ